MLNRSRLLFGLAGVLVALAVLTSPSAAQSTNARPVIIMGEAMVDPSALPLISDDARKTVANAIARLKSGDIAANVFAASGDGKVWAGRSSGNDEVASVEDLARKSLEVCEYYNHAPCLILAVNGHDARDATGTWPIQPQMLKRDDGPFDAERVPFLAAADRGTVNEYAVSTDQRALVITDLGGWYWRTGDTIVEAIASAAGDCKKDEAQSCILYAVNDRVVFTP